MGVPNYISFIDKAGRRLKFLDRTGEVWGELTITGVSEKTDSNLQRYWDCKCSCGNETTVRGSHLTSGRIQSCGNACVTRLVPAEIRFWTHVNKTDTCWLWTGAINNKGYGNFNICGPRDYAHRFSWTLHNGPIPEGMCVLHRCDNPPCVNPGHLFLGTQQDNIDDMVAKGRQATNTGHKGSEHAMAKLTESDVAYIRSSSESNLDLAARFGVSGPSVIWGIRARKTWRHV